MTGKNILIIEPDEFVSSLFNKSFIGFDPNLLITASTDVQVIFNFSKPTRCGDYYRRRCLFT